MNRFPPVLLLLAACSSSDPTEDSAEPISLALEVHVAAGSEILRCQLVKMPATETFVIKAAHHYTTGSHHLVLYKTDFTDIPPALEGIHDCYEDGSDFMSHIRGVVHAGQTPTGEIVLPDGVGLPLAAGSVLMLQAHYINATTEALDADVGVELTTAPADTIHERAGILFFYDPFIYVGPRSSASATMTCNIDKPVTLLSATAHMHARGVGYKAWLETGDTPAAEPFYTTDSWEHPAGWQGPMAIAAGSDIRFACDYENPEDRTFIQGQSAASNEMCMFVGLYYPAMTQADEFCTAGPGMFGAGDASCSATLSCIQTCPPGSAPTQLAEGFFAGGGDPDVHECWQRCLAQSCRSSWGPFFAQLRCIQDKCPVCTGAGGSECTGCVASNCLNEYVACSSSDC